MRVSVVIPTLDRPASLTGCLKALSRTFPEDAETIVIADGGTCDLTPVVAPFVGPLRLRLLQTSNNGPAAARNSGLAIAHGNIVAFTDDDCRPHDGWVAAIASAVSERPPRAVGGLTINGLPSNAYADAAQLVISLLSRHDHDLAGSAPLLPTNNVAFPAEPLRRLGGFDERFRTAEDRELCRRWKAAGYTLGRVESAVVEHDSRLDFARFARKFYTYGRGAARFYGSAEDLDVRQSVRFHLRLPMLLAPELRRRGLARGAHVLGLFGVWEAANLAGYCFERLTRIGERVEGQHGASRAQRRSLRP